jgi:hypothetical protein
MLDLTPIRWFEADPGRLRLELDRVSSVAPDLHWTEEMEGTTGGGWRGECPVWPFKRERPPNLEAFLAGRRFQLEVRCSPAHPVAAPEFVPKDPVPDLWVRTSGEWHVLGNGSLCLMQNTLDWTGRETVDQLILKAAGWLLEFLLLRAGLIDAMTVGGIVEDGSIDHLFDVATQERGGEPSPNQA